MAPTATLAGGRRIKTARKKGPSLELQRQYRKDEKERQKRAEKRERGGKRNDQSTDVAKKLGLGLLAVLLASFLLYQIVSRIEVSPQKVADNLALILLDFAENYGSLTVLLAVGGCITYFGFSKLYEVYQKQQEAANSQAAIKRKEQQRKDKLARRKLTAAKWAEEIRERMQAHKEVIKAEEAELERLNQKLKLNQEARNVRAAKLWEEASRWSPEENALLIEAVDKVPLSLSSEERWEKIAGRIPGRTAEECLTRIKYTREQEERERQELLRYADTNVDHDSTPQESNDYRRWLTKYANEDDISDDDDNDDDNESVLSDSQREKVDIELDPVQKGTRFDLGGTMLWNVGTVRPHLIKVVVSCMRCQLQRTMELSGLYTDQSSLRVRCGKCTSNMAASVRPVLLHETSSTLCYFDSEDCNVVDVLDVMTVSSCIGCGDDYNMAPMKRNFRVEKGCNNCEHKLALQAKKFELTVLSTPKISGARSVGGGSNNKAKKVTQQMTLVQGQPLPENGACKHFTKSLRWMRFPCCGRAYPCPTCHELDGCEGAVNGTLATRMICGKCSKEQNFTNAGGCVACGFHMGKGTKSNFWQGGGGSRDTTTLSKKDTRKHAGSSKTESKKSQRVGQAGARARDAKQKS
eukprot:m.159863 g.159863  ORF g.159863 m.159863 type:complete len:637 (+) comp15159_c0_seq14:255-2165(+)